MVYTGTPTTQLTQTRVFSSPWTRLVADNEEKGETRISNSRKRAKLTINSPLSIRARRLLLQKVSPNVPVFSENGKLVDVMEIIGKENDQLTVQDSLAEACMQAIMWASLDRPCDPWAKSIIFLVTLRISLSTGVASPLLIVYTPLV